MTGEDKIRYCIYQLLHVFYVVFKNLRSNTMISVIVCANKTILNILGKYTIYLQFTLCLFVLCYNRLLFSEVPIAYDHRVTAFSVFVSR